jgi:uncharacterized protein
MRSEDGRTDKSETPRFVPDEPFPPYSYVTGRFPHPTRDPAGHHFGAVPVSCSAPDPNLWRDCRPYLYGLDLFNHGYYWEAHEVWEGLWHASGRTGVAGFFFQGLIKLAAAGVKAREGRPEGIRRHARRAGELFREVAGRLPPGEVCFFGLSLPQLIGFAADEERGPLTSGTPTEAPVVVVFPFVLRPDESERFEPGA